YFRTKEEIFLALFRREYELWTRSLQEVCDRNAYLEKEALASEVARTLAARPRLLKLLAMNVYDMEGNSRVEQLTEFKRTYRALIETFERLFEKFLPGTDKAATKRLLYMFFPFMVGVYPFSNATKKQKEAMKNAGMSFDETGAYDLIYAFLIKLFK
ncbi:MAG: TetR/AcrR family transcriptional regulator, partial [Clostridia bacterium]|nr:TetR/AcrR family transcriptional regulator [Clostridia bacterium]